MKIDYKITKYFEDNNLFDSYDSNGLMLKLDSKSIIVMGNSRDLVEFADLLVNVARSKENSHIHVDDLTLLNKNSDISEIIVEKKES